MTEGIVVKQINRHVRFPELVVLALALVSLFSSVHAAGLDIGTAFPNSQGDNGFYAQAYKPSTLGFRDLARSSAYVFNTAGQSNVRPAVGKYSGQVQLRPCVNGAIYGTEWAVLTYVVPETGIYTLTGTFYGGDASSSTTARIFVNTVADTKYTSAVTGLTTVNFNITALNLTLGNYLRFAIDAGASHSYDVTGLTGTINGPAVIPEPAAVAALVTGLLGVALGYRRKR